MLRARYTLRTAAALVLILFNVEVIAGKAMIAVAGNFTKTAKDLAAVFEEQTGHSAIISYGSTGKLYAQILHGAPYEVYLAADTKHPARLAESGHAVADSRFTYAKGRIALFSMDEDLLDSESPAEDSVKAINKLALANPKTAPYGEAAVEILKSIGIHHTLEDRIILGDNIVQTYQFIYTSNATAGFVSLSQIIHGKTGSHWIVPEEHYTPIKQDAVLLKKGENNLAALAFLEFLQSEEAYRIITHYGYATSNEYALFQAK